MAYRILRAHDVSDTPGKMKIRYDAMISHDITYVGIIQTARASGMKEFPLPYEYRFLELPQLVTSVPEDVEATFSITTSAAGRPPSSPGPRTGST